MERSDGRTRAHRSGMRPYRGLLRPCWFLLELVFAGMSLPRRLCEWLLWQHGTGARGPRPGFRNPDRVVQE
jgi:hypothetical protein